ncbi:MAG: T9SS type A sorting domain-containing protein [Saprospiraceae bacterium]|nr:T9SS type A sorting domain-containing protein [Saprospiraceae bacterium]
MADLVDCENSDLDFNLVVTSDGETGCWDDKSCSLSAPLVYSGEIDCASYPLSVKLENADVCEGACIDLIPRVTGGFRGHIPVMYGAMASPRIPFEVCPEADVTYGLTVTDSEGNTATGSSIIKVRPLPEGAVLPNPLSFCKKLTNDEQPSLAAYLYRASPPYLFNWHVPEDIAGRPDSLNFTNDSYDLDESASTADNYPKQICVTVTDKFGCSSDFCGNIRYNGICTDSCYLVVYDTIRTQIIDTSYVQVEDTLVIRLNVTNEANQIVVNAISIYPNPANSHIFVDMGTYTLLKNYELHILNSLGQPVFFTPIEQQQYYIDLNQWGGKGTYYVRIKNSAGITIETKKILLQ